MVRVGEGAKRAPRVRTMLEMKVEPWVYALRACEVHLFERRCVRDSKLNGDG